MSVPTLLPPLALYLHFPWCVSKCPYCDFNSHALRDSLPETQYLAALAADLEQQAPAVAAHGPVETVFLGGGTPSLFPPEAIGAVLAHARRNLRIAPDAEITLEANPGTIERGSFAEYAAAGITRVSLGAQSFDAATLKILGRIHSPDETRLAANELHAAGIDNFNLDLMYALPGQDVAGAVADVRAALDLAPAQVSHYQLTLEAGTPFAAQPPGDLPDEDTVDAMLEACTTLLVPAGFERYEVSAWAKPGRACRHNLNYWEFGDYLGVGAGAHGKISRVGDGRLEVSRTTRLREPRRYLASAGQPCEQVVVAAGQLPFEFMLNALRLVRGFSHTLFEARTGLPWRTVEGTVSALRDRGLLGASPAGEGPTARGLAFLNELLVEFLPKACTGAPIGRANEVVTADIASQLRH
jgi:oxygen-independent coproporphyrinogen-3 oxidase